MYSVSFKLVVKSLITTCRIQGIRNYFDKQLALQTLNMQADSMDVFLPKNKKTPIRSSVSVQIQVIGSGALGVPSSVVLINNGSRYLINCGEGTQRLGNEYRMGLEKSRNIFITYPSWKNISGLIGLFLDLEKASHEDIIIHGQSCIGTLFSATKKFVHAKDLPKKFKHCSHYEEFSDDNITVKYIYLNPVVDEKKDVTDEKKKQSRNEPKKSPETLHVKKNFRKPAISFIFDTGSTSGALCFQKCIDLGVPPGPLLGLLKSGKDVTLKNGTVVKSVDVTEPDLPGVIVIAVECPSENYLESLLKEPEYYKYQSGENIAGAVIHFSSSKVIKNEKYQEWIKRFPKTTKHLFINENNKATGSVGTQRQQYKLNFLCPEFFPLLQDTEIPDFPRSKNSSENGHTVVSISNQSEEQTYSDRVFYKCVENSFINGETMCTLFFKPKYEYDYSKCLVLKKDLFLKEMFKNNSQEKIEKCKQKIKDIENSVQSDNRIYPKVVFLGTGSSKPSKVRNASAILIFLDKNKCMLFDCGESTYNQLINLYGKQRVYEILRNLDAIFISHLHVDHHMGLITLLKERKLAFEGLNQVSLEQLNPEVQMKIVRPQFQPVFLLAPVQIRHWLHTYCEEIEDISKLYDLLPNSFLIEGSGGDLINKVEMCKKTLNMDNILTTLVYHCKGAFGISIKHKDGWKITYSGDTRPCKALVKLGENSDILIHESTFEDAFSAEAETKGHSTTSQAVEIGKQMNANYILLTHFSQRYCYLPVIDEKFNNLNVGIAFDYMEVPFNKLPILPALLEPLQYIYSDFNERVKTLTQYIYLKRGLNETDFSPERNSQDLITEFKIPKRCCKSEN